MADRLAAGLPQARRAIVFIVAVNKGAIHMGKYCYEYPRPAVAADIVVLQSRPIAPQILLIQRARDPFIGQWALPGGFVEMDETSAHAAVRELQEETGLSDVSVELLGVFDAPGRDPRGRVISIAYLAILPADRPVHPQGADDASRADWFDLHSLPPLAFDHADIIAATRERLALRNDPAAR